jgi:hypothetical protein
MSQTGWGGGSPTPFLEAKNKNIAYTLVLLLFFLRNDVTLE